MDNVDKIPSAFWQHHFLRLAKEHATAGTCHRRQVGAVITSQDNRILSTGVNGVPAGYPHCRARTGKEIIVLCPGATATSGTNIDSCKANHAEMNAVMLCLDKDKAYTLYTTTSPCMSCLKVIIQSKVKHIIFIDEYPGSNVCRDFWIESGKMIGITRTWQKPAEVGYRCSNPDCGDFVLSQEVGGLKYCCTKCMARYGVKFEMILEL